MILVDIVIYFEDDYVFALVDKDGHVLEDRKYAYVEKFLLTIGFFNRPIELEVMAPLFLSIG